MTPTWRLLNTGFHSGAFNMALDEAIMLQVGRGEALPTIRFYRWQPPCLSVGYFQSVFRDVDLDAAARLGVEVVRRPTGGRAVLHEHELTYSVIALESTPQVSGDVGQSYAKISLGLLAGLAVLGVQAQRAKRVRQGSSPFKTGFCFDAASPYEILVHGRKLVGSAQVRRGGVLLQHGSVLTDLDEGKLFGVLRLPEGSRSQAQAYLRSQTITLREVLSREVTFEEVARATQQGFVEGLGITLAEDTWTPLELSLAQGLQEKKYATPEWNLRR